MSPNALYDIVHAFHNGTPKGITSVCSAHPWVIEAALRFAKKRGTPALIEATCNQVNQEGGYTGMTPADFRDFVTGIAQDVGFEADQIILGGDHLGPNPWKELPSDTAMAKAAKMISAYAEAGFTKLHLDTSMGCAGESAALPDEITAKRAAELAKVVENLSLEKKPVYVIGTEVPVPGGATHALDHLELTSVDGVSKTITIHQEAFAAKGLHSAFERVIGLVVQPGVEFGHTDVIHFDPERAAPLTAHLKRFPSLVYEAHSTDYQHTHHLNALIDGGFAILKVGPWLTFALRQALYALDQISDILEGRRPEGRLFRAIEELMQEHPENWRKYYAGNDKDQFALRHFSLSDRIRYYWPHPKAQAAVEELITRLEGRNIPAPLLQQFGLDQSLAKETCSVKEIAMHAVEEVLGQYCAT